MHAVTDRRRLLLAGAAATALAMPRLARAEAGGEVRVVSSGGLNEVLATLRPEFERATGLKVHAESGSSMGASPTAIPQRLERGERFDVMLLAAEAFDAYAARGQAMAGSRVDIARSLIGMAVRQGAPVPDISTVERFRQVLLDAKSIGYSASASGVYIEAEMFRRLGIHDQVMPKARKILTLRVASVVASGEVEIGFQQVSEILPIPGVTFAGPIPEEVQRATIFSGGLGANPANLDGGRALLRFLASEQAAPVLVRNGLEPLLGRNAAARPARG